MSEARSNQAAGHSNNSSCTVMESRRMQRKFRPIRHSCSPSKWVRHVARQSLVKHRRKVYAEDVETAINMQPENGIEPLKGFSNFEISEMKLMYQHDKKSLRNHLRNLLVVKPMPRSKRVIPRLDIWRKKISAMKAAAAAAIKRTPPTDEAKTKMLLEVKRKQFWLDSRCAADDNDKGLTEICQRKELLAKPAITNKNKTSTSASPTATATSLGNLEMPTSSNGILLPLPPHHNSNGESLVERMNEKERKTVTVVGLEGTFTVCYRECPTGDSQMLSVECIQSKQSDSRTT